MPDQAIAIPATVDLRSEFETSGVKDVLSELDRELIGLAPVKKRIRETAALLLVEKARKAMGLANETPTLHMSFSGNPGNELLAAEGLAPHAVPAVRGMIGNGLEKLVERAFAARGIAPDQEAMRGRRAAMAGIYARHLTNLTTPRPGAREAVRAARRPGCRAAS